MGAMGFEKKKNLNQQQNLQYKKNINLTHTPLKNITLLFSRVNNSYFSYVESTVG